MLQVLKCPGPLTPRSENLSVSSPADVIKLFSMPWCIQTWKKNMFYNVLPIFLQQHYNSIYTSIFQSLSFVIFPVVIPSCMVVFTFHFSTFCKLYKTLNAYFLLLFGVMLLSHVIISRILSSVILWVFLTIATFICYNTTQNVSCCCKLGVSYYFPIIKVIFCWITAWLHNWNYTTHIRHIQRFQNQHNVYFRCKTCNVSCKQLFYSPCSHTGKCI